MNKTNITVRRIFSSLYSDKEKNSLFFQLAHSWWPWRLSSNEGKCVLRTQDGWIKRPCNELQAFICERDINRRSIPLTVRCGNAQAPLSSTIITTTTTSSSSSVSTIITTSTRRPTVSFIQPPIVHENIPSPIYKNNNFAPTVTSLINSEPVEIEIDKKTNSIDPSNIKKYFIKWFSVNLFLILDILAAILGGVAIAIFSVNIIVCFLCRRYKEN